MFSSILSSIFLLKSFLFFFHLVFSHQDFLFKLVIIFLLLETFILLKYGEELKLNKLSKLKKHQQDSLWGYKIVNKSDLLLSISYVLSYISIFILGILYLRIQNQNKEIHLVNEITKIKGKILQSSYINNTTSLIIIFLLILTVITLYQKLFSKFKFHLKRLHLYLSQYEDYWEIFFFREKYRSKKYKFYTYTISSFHSYIHKGLENLGYLFNLSKKSIAIWSKDEQGNPKVTWIDYESSTWDYLQMDLRSQITWPLLCNLHYLILSSSLFFDLFLNNLTLKNYFYFLPFFFLYHNWLRFSSAVDQLAIEPCIDLMKLFYKNCYQENDNIFTEEGEFVCNIYNPNGLKYLYSFLDTFVHPDLQNYFPKGKIVRTLERITNFISSRKIVERIRKYNYRSKAIKVHKILTLQPTNY